MRKRLFMWLIPAVIISGILAGPIMSDVEQAKYEVINSQNNIEVRQYEPAIAAEVNVSGGREEAINEGFKLLADYIFGNNQSSSEVAMTAPVIQQPGEEIAMTAPVTSQNNGRDWKVRFIMPSEYTMQTIPKPNNPEVKLVETKGKTFAVIRFSGSPEDEDLQARETELKEFIKLKNLTSVSKPVYAFFNPPWTLPLLRRNEVMIEVDYK